MASGFTNVEVDTWLDVIPQVCCKRYSVITTERLRIDHRPNPNAQCQHASKHQQSIDGRWQTSSTGFDISSDCGFQILERGQEERSAEHHGPYAGSQPYNCRPGALRYINFVGALLTIF